MPTSTPVIKQMLLNQPAAASSNIRYLKPISNMPDSSTTSWISIDILVNFHWMATWTAGSPDFCSSFNKRDFSRPSCALAAQTHVLSFESRPWRRIQSLEMTPWHAPSQRQASAACQTEDIYDRSTIFIDFPCNSKNQKYDLFIPTMS